MLATHDLSEPWVAAERFTKFFAVGGSHQLMVFGIAWLQSPNGSDSFMAFIGTSYDRGWTLTGTIFWCHTLPKLFPSDASVQHTCPSSPNIAGRTAILNPATLCNKTARMITCKKMINIMINHT